MKKEFEWKGRKHDGPPKCYGCGEIGHIKPRCPKVKHGKDKPGFKKKRAYISWGGDSGDESTNQEEGEAANLCLMAHGDQSNDVQEQGKDYRHWFDSLERIHVEDDEEDTPLYINPQPQPAETPQVMVENEDQADEEEHEEAQEQEETELPVAWRTNKNHPLDQVIGSINRGNSSSWAKTRAGLLHPGNPRQNLRLQRQLPKNASTTVTGRISGSILRRSAPAFSLSSPSRLWLPERFPELQGYDFLDGQLHQTGLCPFVSRTQKEINPALIRVFYSNLRRDDNAIDGFTGDIVEVEGSIVPLVELGTGEKSVRKKMQFIAVDIKCVHNAILRRPGINQVQVVISMLHLCMKFYTPSGVDEVRGDQRNARECYAWAVKKMMKGVNIISQEITKEETQERIEPKANSVEIELHPGDNGKVVRIDANMPKDL
ncbi:unnamed protein product [Cuscuta campestris]|uniref:CCHC-type domain-containing protein n=1 Tax=Cuscuta campestris TaxID=132261 RepID=A0A484M2I2_9ASTE|nr:unnamed protein product [Cuscuta campestris]